MNINRHKYDKIILMCFDTEATSVIDDRGAYAVLYNWDFLRLDTSYETVTKDNIDDCTTRFEGRDCETLYDFLDNILYDAKTNNVQYKIAVHNLSYDYQYLRHWLISHDTVICAKNSTHLLNIKVDDNLVFFDTLSIFGYSLRVLGENLGYSKGDIDYSQDIAPDTVLGSNNVFYNHRDTSILMVGICQSLFTRPCIDLDTIGTRILTKTGIVRKQDKANERIGHMRVKGKKRNGIIYDEDRRKVKKLQFRTPDEYMRWESYSYTVRTDVKGCYAGGINICNMNLIGTILHDVSSYDLKSAYPAQMITYNVCTNPIDIDTVSEYDYLLERCIPNPMDVSTCKCAMWRGTVKLENVMIDDEWFQHIGDSTINETMVCQHMNDNVGVEYKYGVFFHADTLYLTVAFPTWYEFCAQYTFDNATFTELTIYTKCEPPTRYMQLRTLHHYNEKTVSKNIAKGKGDIDYALAQGFISIDEYSRLKSGDYDEEWLSSFTLRHKADLNALYGILVTSAIHDTYTFDEWGNISVAKGQYDVDQKTDAMMWREAGVLVALYNRYKMVYTCALLAMNGYDVIASDTDSVKVLGISQETMSDILHDMHESIEKRNVFRVETLIQSLNANCRELGIIEYDTEISDDIRNLGKFDYEGTYRDFVVYGHKKYAYGNGTKWKYKCAGYSIKVLGNFSRQLESNGLYEIAPHVVLGFDNRYDSTTCISSIQVGILPTWVNTRFKALDDTEHGTYHEYSGSTCPGSAIFKAGKIMNNTEHSKLNLQRKLRCIELNADVQNLYGIDIAFNDEFVFGKRGSVYMEWSNFEHGDDA